MKSTSQSRAVRFLALGDSYTIGEAEPEAARWPLQLASRLREQGVAIDPPRILANTGWTTDELSAAIDQATFDPPYDLVSLLIGVNNEYRGRGLDEYRTQFTALLERVIALAGNDPARVIVVGFPDWGVTPFGRGSGRDTAQVARETDAFNAAAQQIAQQHQVTFVDIAAVSRPHGDLAQFDRGMVAPDGLHPSAAMYAGWVEAVLPVALKKLRQPGSTPRPTH